MAYTVPCQLANFEEQHTLVLVVMVLLLLQTKAQSNYYAQLMTKRVMMRTLGFVSWLLWAINENWRRR